MFRNFRQEPGDRILIVQRKKTVRKFVVRRMVSTGVFVVFSQPVQPFGNDRTSETNVVVANFFKPLLGRFGQYSRHRTEQRYTVLRPGSGDGIEMILTASNDDRRAVIPSVERIAGVARSTNAVARKQTGHEPAVQYSAEPTRIASPTKNASLLQSEATQDAASFRWSVNEYITPRKSNYLRIHREKRTISKKVVQQVVQ
ncbi:MAG: hypothetical protein IT427_10600 [Pirellulales bacterium]|nr:hypothetical protein [Pirellulales bacterium]